LLGDEVGEEISSDFVIGYGNAGWVDAEVIVDAFEVGEVEGGKLGEHLLDEIEEFVQRYGFEVDLRILIHFIL
jgi:hypothetical protein